MGTGQHVAVERTLRALRPGTAGQRALREAFLGFLAAREDACERTCMPGHFTASAVVLDAAGTATCLVHHRIVGAWLQPGGHLEPGEDPATAALREASEETGLAGLRLDPEPLHLDAHPITCRGATTATRHLDVRFLVVAPGRDAPVASAESHRVEWFEMDDLPPLFDEVRELLDAARDRLCRTGQPIPGGTP